MKSPVVLVLLLLFLMASAALAGDEYDISCRSCGLKEKIVIGGGFYFHQVSTYCSNKEHFVSICWNVGAWFPPRPVRKENGIRIYKCPDCKTPTAREWPVVGEPKTCPRCGSKKIKFQHTGLVYD